MDEFFKKHGHHLTGEDAMSLMHDTFHKAKDYYKEGKVFEALKCLKEMHSMIDTFVSVLES